MVVEASKTMSIRRILKTGATVFGLSAVLLLLAPGLFLELLGLNGSDDALAWSMRMIGITLVALALNMWLNSTNPDDAVVRHVGQVMAVCATALGILTLLIPTSFTWFAIVYAAIGFGFGLAYVLALSLKRP